MPLVSIVTPTYNQAQFVAETVESVLAQTYKNIEYIVLDDGSTDETPEVLRRYANVPGVRVLRHDNIGQTATINKGWAMSQGDVIAWINSDDTLTPNAVAEAVAALEAQPKALAVYGNCDNMDAGGGFMGHYPARQETLTSLTFYQNAIGIPQPSTFLRRSVLAMVGYLDPFIYYCMDLDYWFRVLLKGEMVFVEGAPWSRYRVHPAAKTSAQLARSAPDFVYVYGKLASCSLLPAALARRRREIAAHGHWIAGRRFMYGGAKNEARREAWVSLLAAPTRWTGSKLRLLAGRS